MGRIILKLPERAFLTFIIAGVFAGMAMAQEPAGGAKPESAKKAPAKIPAKTESPKPAAKTQEKTQSQKPADPKPAGPAAAPAKSTPEKTANAKADVPGDEDGDAIPADADNAEVSGLPVPRFVSLRTDPINLRSGPGRQYPVDWVYHRRHLPVEVVKEFDTWRRIRDPDGTEGWVHQSMITGHRTAVVRGSAQALRRNDGDDASSIATLETGVIVSIQRCPAGSLSCRVEVDGLQGWLKRDQVWGVYPTETVE